MKVIKQKPGDRHQAFVEHSNKIFAIKREQDATWDQYMAKCKDLLRPAEDAKGRLAIGSWFMYDSENQDYQPLIDESSLDGLYTISNSAENEVVLVENLQSNYFFDITAASRRADPDVDEGESTSKGIYSPQSPVVGCSTKTAPWQLALEKAGLRHLIEPFSESGLSSFSKWIDIPRSESVV